MKKYIHIGYPKNLSTTLQRDFFPKHPNLKHLGVGVKTNIDYLDDNLNLLFEDYLLYASERKYRQVATKSKESLDIHFSDTDPEPEALATGISAELLSFKFSPDHIDTETKALRLRELFGADTTIIMLIRNQYSLLKSLYREVIKIGYPGTFQDFIEYTFYYQDRNFALDFCYDETVELYSSLFGRQNVKVLPIESIRDPAGHLLTNSDGQNMLVAWLCEALDVPYADLPLNHYNEPLNDVALNTKRHLNQSRPHDLGLDMYNSVNGHRLVKYFNNDLEVPLPKRLHEGLLLKRQSIDEAQSGASIYSRAIDYYADPYLLNRLLDKYRKSNQSLAEFVTLPPVYKLSGLEN